MSTGASRGGLVGRLADEFDLAWQQPTSPDLGEFYRRLLAGAGRALDAGGRLAVLEELIRIDLEYRWKPRAKGVVARWRVKDYVGRFAELRAGGWDGVPLAAEEFRVRSLWGDRPDARAFAAEHSHLEPRLTPALAGVQRSLGPVPSPAPPPPTDPPTVVPPTTRRDTPTLPPADDSTLARPPTVTGDPTEPEPAAPSDLPAEIAGYRVQRELGRGGMGVVYKAWDARLGRPVALKVILVGELAGKADLDRFDREAKAVAALKHPNVVQILQYGQTDRGPFVALEYVAGGSLSAHLRGNPQPAEYAAAVVQAAAEGVAAAHAAGIVHRDLKPANVLMDAPAARGGRPAKPKIADFGLAKRMDDDQKQTRTGVVIGTPVYMAPEQAAGRVREVGPPADVHALGVILYEMLVGRPPFRGATVPETLDLVQHKEPVPPRLLQPTVPPDLQTICLKCLRKDPAQRYPTAAELVADLTRYREGRPILARPVGAAEAAWKFYRRKPLLVYTVGGVFALLAALVVLALALAGVSAAQASDQLKKEQAELTKEQAELKATAAELGRVKTQAEADRKQAEAGRTITAQQYDLLIGAAERELTNGDVAQAERYLELCLPAAAEKGGAAGGETDEQRRAKAAWEWRHLWRRCDGDRKPLSGHAAGLWAVAAHPTAAEAATASIDGGVRRWDTATGAALGEFRGHADPALGQLADTERLLKRTLPLAAAKSLWDMASDRMDRVSGGAVGAPPFVPTDLPKHLSPVLRVAYSPDGEVLASGGLEPNIDPAKLAAAVTQDTDPKKAANPTGVVRVWKRQGGREVGRHATHKTLVTAVAFHPDGKRVASAGLDDDHTWRLWEWDTTAPAVVFAGHTGVVSQVRFTADGTRAATGSTDGTAVVWDVATGTPKHTFEGHRATVHDLAFSPDGTRLATAGMDGTVRVWNLDDPTAAAEVRRGHIGAALGVAFSPDGRRVASAGFDRTVRVWDAAHRDGGEADREKLTLRGHTEAVWGVAFDRDGRLVSAAFDGTARVWDATPSAPAGRPLAANTPDRPDADRRVNRLAYSPNGKVLAAAGWDGTATLRDAATGAVLRPLDHKGPVWGVAFSPDGTRVLTGSWDGTVRLWDAATGDEQAGAGGVPFAKFALPVQSVAFGRTGRVVAAGTWDGTVKVWDSKTGADLHTFADHLLPVYDLAFGPDDEHLASAGGDRKAVVRSLKQDRKVELKEPHTATVYRVAFDRGGRRLAVASWDRTVSLWDFTPRNTTATRTGLIDGHADYVNGLAFRPDGKRLATAGNDRTVREWDASGKPAGDPHTLRGAVWDVTYRPDGGELAAAVWNPKGWVRLLPAAK